MKRGILIFFLSVASLIAFAQDKMYTHNGDSITCQVLEVSEKNIKFNYVGETLTNSISKNTIQRIVFLNGRVQRFGDKIIINSEKDWEKVQITNIESDIEGLTKVQTFSEKAKGTTYSSQGNVEKRVIKKLQKEAAKAGCHILLITRSTGKSGGFYSNANSRITAIGYKY